MKIHDLKTWPEQFQAVVDGIKRFEVRKNDRDFKEGDGLILREFDPSNSTFSGRSIRCLVSCIVHGGSFGLPMGVCVLGLNVGNEATALLQPYVNSQKQSTGFGENTESTMKFLVP